MSCNEIDDLISWIADSPWNVVSTLLFGLSKLLTVDFLLMALAWIILKSVIRVSQRTRKYIINRLDVVVAMPID